MLISGTSSGTFAAIVTGTGTTYNAAVSGMVGNGTVILSVPAGGAHDKAGNDNLASTSTDNVVQYIDLTVPTVTVEQAAGQADPSNASSIDFEVVFSEPVTGFVAGDVTLSGSAPGTLSAVVTGSGVSYSVAVSGMTGDGTVIVDLPAGVATDAAGNVNASSTSTDNMVFFDNTPPAAPSAPDLAPASDSGSSDSDNLTSATKPRFTGMAEIGSMVTLLNGANVLGTDVVDAGGFWSITSTVNLPEGLNNVTAKATDLVGNTSVASGALAVTIDTTAPTVTLEQTAGQADPTADLVVNFGVVFSEATTAFDSTDVVITGTAAATTANISGSGTTDDVAISGMANDGTVIVNVVAGVFADAAGNNSAASTSTDNTVTYETDGPAVLSISPSGTIETSLTTIDITFDEPMGGTSLSNSDIAITGPLGGTITPANIVLSAPDTFTVTVPVQVAAGSYNVSVGPDIRDLAGNQMDQNGNQTNGEAILDLFTGLITLSLPDLIPSSIIAPANALPGTTVPVSWTDTNTGLADTPSGYNARIFLSADGVIGSDLLLGTFSIPALAAGTAVIRNVNVSLPQALGFAGTPKFVVVTDSSGGILEHVENNNAAIDNDTTSIPNVLFVNVPIVDIAENSSSTVLATVTRSGDRSAALSVTLSSDATELSVPSGVTIPVGQPSAGFSFTALTDGIVDLDQLVNIVGTAAGHQDGVGSVTVLDIDRPTLSISFSGVSVTEGQSVTATITRTLVDNQSLTVSFFTPQSNQLNLPARAVIPPNLPTVDVILPAIDDVRVEADVTLELQAIANGFDSLVSTIDILDNDVPGLTVSVTPNVISEGAGVFAATGTVTRDIETSLPLVVVTGVGDASEVFVAPAVTIPANQASATFPIHRR